MDVAGCSTDDVTVIDDEKQVSCPICEKFMCAKEIVEHVDRCLFLRQEDEITNSDVVESPRDGKRVFPLFDKHTSSEPGPKKMKFDSASKKKRNVIDLTMNEDSECESKKNEGREVPLAEKVRPKTMEEFIG